MFDFVRFVAKSFMRLSETTPPNIAGTPSLLAAIRGPETIDVPRRKQSPMKFPETSRHGAAGPDVGERWPSRLVATAAANCLRPAKN